ncbi:HNH endonuclease [Nocardia otitidiscaviarum]|uniref:HNH endonuclease n=1 Tax=Nocardia otitidiscaviarum TaxID=1823 RepID=UPI00189367CB|nr:HNH endonuclease [Nocardia otitidiscaviarum]
MHEASDTPEVWKPIPGVPHYFASDHGRIRRESHTITRRNGSRQALRAADITGWVTDGYRRFRVGRTTYRVHQVVALTFHGPRPEGLQTRHLNGNALDNRAINLEYGTGSENAVDAVTHGTHPMSRKTHCRNGHPYEESNTYLDRRGERRCATCTKKSWAQSAQPLNERRRLAYRQARDAGLSVYEARRASIRA